MNVIDSYRFGSIVVSGKRYSSDVIISPDRFIGDWQRVREHQLCLKDIAEVIAETPEALVVGTGASGLVKVLPEVEQGVKSQGIKPYCKSN